MANFKHILEALGEGKIDIEALSSQLQRELIKYPQSARKTLEELDEAHALNAISDQHYTQLKRQINQFRRLHAEATEIESDASLQATVFAHDSVMSATPVSAAMDNPAAAGEGQKTSAAITDASAIFPDTSVPGAENSTPSITAASGPAGTRWNAPALAIGDLSGNYDVGSIIKQRFKLLKILGVGGMGKVYKALDLLKAEAQDKKPHVAIKLLNDDFKEHPEAFISLQREASRQQKLAHPNIATIYDFDRVGGPNTPVFITMEFLDGLELKDYIKKKIRAKGGLPFAEAYEIIKQLGAGLIYAHERQLVHSDFKPGNAFLCNDGVVKTLDFGIARAVKNPVTGQAEKTLFDAGRLGALTPAYASLEMLEGKEPDTRDDTYALGCTAYELLTGKHPFNKLPANKAKAKKLAPAYVKTLNRKQNRALRRAVAFHRADRSPSVAYFLEELRGKATWHKNPFVIAAGVLLVVGLAAFEPAREYLHKQKLNSMMTGLAGATAQTMAARLAETRLLEKSDQVLISSDEAAKRAIQAYFSDKIATLIDDSDDNYDFRAAQAVVAEIREFYPDSVFLQEQSSLLSRAAARIIGELTKQYVTTLKDFRLIDSTSDILAKIARIDPAHPLIGDPRLANAYRLLALQQLETDGPEAALDLVRAGMATRAGRQDPRLADLETRILREQRVAELEAALGQAAPRLSALDAFKAEQAVIVELAQLAPGSALLASLSDRFAPAVRAELATILGSGSRPAAEELVAAYGELMNSLGLNEQLMEARLINLKDRELRLYVNELAASAGSSIEFALTEPRLDDPQWEAGLLKDVQELSALAKQNETLLPELLLYRERIADLYAARAGATIAAARYDAAASYIDRAERYAPGAPPLAEARLAITGAREENERRARVEANKNDLKTFAEGNNIAEALEAFEALKADLPETDVYLTFEAPQLLAASLARQAETAAGNGDYEAARSLAARGLELDPANVLLNTLEDEYEAEVNIAELSRLFRSAELVFPAAIRLKASQIENASPARYAEFSKASAAVLAERINALSARDESGAAALARTAAQLFPANAVLADLRAKLQLRPWDGLVAANTSIAAGKLSQARRLQQEATAEFAAHPDFIAFASALETRIGEADNVYNIYQQDKAAAGEDFSRLRASRNLLMRALALWTDNPDYAAEQDELERLIEAARPKPKPRIRVAEQPLAEITVAAATPATTPAEGGQTAAPAPPPPWRPIASESECTARLAGYGRRARAICYDMIHASARGPLLVVAPGGEGFERPFAISKYEISISDWGKYCILSGTCEAIKDQERRNEPITGISLQRAREYAAWLSERTGKTYRLPTRAEWEYAAAANGKQPSRDFNCQVSAGGKLIKGTGTVSVRSGNSNGWGIKNYIGNVQEWVVDGGSTLAKGGAFTDAHAKCDISLERPHSGAPDEITGLRLLREDIAPDART